MLYLIRWLCSKNFLNIKKSFTQNEKGYVYTIDHGSWATHELKHCVYTIDVGLPDFYLTL